MAFGIFLLLGGIGMFLFGINYMSVSLQQLAGNRLRIILQRMTSNSVKAMLTGLGVTALIQSSGAVSVILVGFVNASLLSLEQCLYAMLGANIGTTVTAQIIAFKIDAIAPLILFVGVSMYLFFKDRLIHRTGAVILGFGLLFMGIYVMGQAVDELGLSALLEGFLHRFSNPLLSLLFGVLFTAVIQSSSASIGILQVFMAGAATSGLGLDAVVYMILGMNIGACSPVVIASFAGDRNCKCAALSDVIAKSVAVLFFSLLTLIFPGLIDSIASLSPGDISRQIANLHLVFNLMAALSVFPLVKLIIRILVRIWPKEELRDPSAMKLLYLNDETLKIPLPAAVIQAKQEIVRMGRLAAENLHRATDGFFAQDASGMDEVEETERTLDFLNHEITRYLVELNGRKLSDSGRKTVGMMFRVVADIERIGDHAENVAEYTQIAQNEQVAFSEAAWLELQAIAVRSIEVVDMSIDIYLHDDMKRLGEINIAEDDVDQMQVDFVNNHIERLKSVQCNPRGGVIFTDIISDFERCADHAINIAFAIKGDKGLDHNNPNY